VSSSGNAGLSKSLILTGMQCPTKAFYLIKNNPAFKFPLHFDLEAKFRFYNEIGRLAQQHFIGGGEVIFDGLTITQQFIIGEDITDAALERQTGLPELIADLRTTLADGCPDIDIGPSCNAPYECDFIPYYWQHISKNSILDGAICLYEKI